MIDIVFFAIIAVVLGLRLWSKLGQRDDGDLPGRNPFNLDDDNQLPSDGNVVSLPQRGNRSSTLLTCFAPPPNSLAGGIDQIRRADPAFDEKEFLAGAEKAFRRIVQAFAAGDISAVGRLLSGPVLYSFQQAIDARTKNGQSLQTSIKEISDKEIAAVRIEDTKAFVTVSFVSKQVNILTDVSGTAISGGADQVETAQDVWTFMRDTSSSNPNWQVVETKE